jgi:hypothetical protein
MSQPDEKPTVREKIANALDRSPRIVDDWRKGWRWASTRSIGLAIAVQGTWAMLDADQRRTLPPNFPFYLTIAVLALALGGRFIKQFSGDDDGSS